MVYPVYSNQSTVGPSGRSFQLEFSLDILCSFKRDFYIISCSLLLSFFKNKMFSQAGIYSWWFCFIFPLTLKTFFSEVSRPRASFDCLFVVSPFPWLWYLLLSTCLYCSCADLLMRTFISQMTQGQMFSLPRQRCQGTEGLLEGPCAPTTCLPDDQPPLSPSEVFLVSQM